MSFGPIGFDGRFLGYFGAGQTLHRGARFKYLRRLGAERRTAGALRPVGEEAEIDRLPAVTTVTT